MTELYKNWQCGKSGESLIKKSVDIEAMWQRCVKLDRLGDKGPFLECSFEYHVAYKEWLKKLQTWKSKCDNNIDKF
jgi:hypothetical protein